jgi:NitT/TauT family transport system ATP-binding protein
MIITLDGVTKIYSDGDKGKMKALDGVTFTVPSGAVTAVMGPSGCGKTTLLNIIAGIDTDYSGTLTFSCVRRPRTGYLFQTPSLIPWRTIWDNILIGPELDGGITNRHQATANVLLDKFELSDFRDSYPGRLSQGMQQRASLIRLLLHGAELLLLDEAFARIDPGMRSLLYSDIIQLMLEGRTVILVSHDIEEAITLADNIVILSPRPGTVISQIAIVLPHKERLEQPLAKSDLLLPVFRQVSASLPPRRKGNPE